jgi:hypothetical protein
VDYGHMQESILKTSSPSSKKYAKVHEKAPKIPNLKSQDPNKSKTQIPNTKSTKNKKAQADFYLCLYHYIMFLLYEWKLNHFCFQQFIANAYENF